MAMEIQLNLIIESRIYLEGITAYLEGDSAITVQKSFCSSATAFREMKQSDANVVVIDSHIKDAFPLVEFIKNEYTDTKVILMLFGEDNRIARTCLQAGAEGLITNSDGMQDLKNCIDIVHSGHLCYPAEFVNQLYSSSITLPRDLPSPNLLTSRQIKVVELIANGHSNKEIARKLNIQLSTVKNHVHQILDRMHVRNRCEAAAVYRKNAQ